jgi:hypothetical protein
MKRRDLIKLLGAALGGVSLSTCGESETTGPAYGPPQLPNGFRFFPVFDSGDSLPGGTPFGHFRLDAAIDDQDEIYFGCVDSSHAPALYALRMDYAGRAPNVVSVRKVVGVGDVLAGGRTVLGVDHYDVNAEGGIAVVLTFAHPSAADGGPGTMKEVWLDLTKSGLERALYEGSVTSDGHRLGGMFGDIDIHDGHHILLTAWYLHVNPQAGQPRPPDAPDDDVIRQGLFLLPEGDPAQAQLELHNDQLVAPNGGTATIGLIDMDDGLRYVLQANPSRVGTAKPAPADVGPTPAGGGFLVQGRVGARGRGLARLSRAAASPAGLADLVSSAPVGDAVFGPRMGPDQLTAYVLHVSETATALYYQGLEVIHSGAQSPRGSTVGTIMPPVFGTNGEIYYVLMTRDGHELCVANGDEQRTLLARGDRLSNDARRVNSIMLGHTTDAVDGEGRIVFVTVFDDQTAAVTVGIPT